MIRAITQMLSMWRPFLSPTHVGTDEFNWVSFGQCANTGQVGEGLMIIHCINYFVLIS